MSITPEEQYPCVMAHKISGGRLPSPAAFHVYASWSMAAWQMLRSADEALYFWHILVRAADDHWCHRQWQQLRDNCPEDYALLQRYSDEWQTERVLTRPLPEIGEQLRQGGVATVEWLAECMEGGEEGQDDWGNDGGRERSGDADSGGQCDNVRTHGDNMHTHGDNVYTHGENVYTHGSPCDTPESEDEWGGCYDHDLRWGDEYSASGTEYGEMGGGYFEPVAGQTHETSLDPACMPWAQGDGAEWGEQATEAGHAAFEDGGIGEGHADAEADGGYLRDVFAEMDASSKQVKRLKGKVLRADDNATTALNNSKVAIKALGDLCAQGNRTVTAVNGMQDSMKAMHAHLLELDARMAAERAARQQESARRDAVQAALEARLHACGVDSAPVVCAAEAQHAAAVLRLSCDEATAPAPWQASQSDACRLDACLRAGGAACRTARSTCGSDVCDLVACAVDRLFSCDGAAGACMEGCAVNSTTTAADCSDDAVAEVLLSDLCDVTLSRVSTGEPSGIGCGVGQCRPGSAAVSPRSPEAPVTPLRTAPAPDRMLQRAWATLLGEPADGKLWWPGAVPLHPPVVTMP